MEIKFYYGVVKRNIKLHPVTRDILSRCVHLQKAFVNPSNFDDLQTSLEFFLFSPVIRTFAHFPALVLSSLYRNSPSLQSSLESRKCEHIIIGSLIGTRSNDNCANCDRVIDFKLIISTPPRLLPIIYSQATFVKRSVMLFREELEIIVGRNESVKGENVLFEKENIRKQY